MVIMVKFTHQYIIGQFCKAVSEGQEQHVNTTPEAVVLQKNSWT